jgi:hypothetical protein
MHVEPVQVIRRMQREPLDELLLGRRLLSATWILLWSRCRNEMSQLTKRRSAIAAARMNRSIRDDTLPGGTAMDR